MGKNIKKNYIYNVLYQILYLITPLITSPYLARVLGADGIGTYSYINSVVSYFVLVASMGIATLGQREVSYYQDNKQMRTKVFWEVKLLQAMTSVFCFVAYLGFSAFQENSILYLICGVNILNLVFDVSWFYQGMEEFGTLVFRNILFKIIHVIYIFVVIRSKEDLTWYMFETVFSTISAVSLWPKLPSLIGKPIFRELRPFRHMKTSLSLFVPTIAIQVYTVLDKTMIGIITQNSFENGYYEQALRISKMTLSVVAALGTVMIPRIGKLFYEKNTAAIYKYMYQSYRFVWFLGIPLCFGLIMTAGNFIPWFLGPGYDKVVLLLRILSFLILAIGISNVTGLQYLIPTQRQKLLSISVIVGATVNFICNIILIHKFQSIGAAIASVIAETTVTVVQLIIVRKELSPWKVLKEGMHYFLAGILMVIVLIPFQLIFTPSISHSVIMLIVGATVYFVTLIVIKDEFFLLNLEKTINAINRKVIIKK